MAEDGSISSISKIPVEGFTEGAGAELAKGVDVGEGVGVGFGVFEAKGKVENEGKLNDGKLWAETEFKSNSNKNNTIANAKSLTMLKN